MSFFERAHYAILHWIDGPTNVAVGGVTKDWPVSDLPTVLACITAYLTFVVAGRRAMEARDAVNPYGLKFAYNISQMVLCAYMTVEAGLLAYRHGYTLWPQCVPFVGAGAHREPPVAKLLWLFYVSKIWDFWDTVFIVLGKKWRQLSFLHVYHHTTIFAFYWINLHVAYDGAIYLTVLLNGAVHFVMYTYYFVSMHIEKGADGKGGGVWWKRYVTIAQMVQFLIMMTQAVLLIAENCAAPSTRNVKAYLLYIFSLFLLFANFFKTTYNRKKQKAP